MSFKTNQVAQSGNIAAPKYIPTRTGVIAEINVCINDKYLSKTTGQEVATIDWFTWKAIGKYGEIVRDMDLQKGDAVVCFGRASQEKWQGKEGQTLSRIVFVASSIMKVDRKKKDSVQGSLPVQEPVQASPSAEPQVDEDMPF